MSRRGGFSELHGRNVCRRHCARSRCLQSRGPHARCATEGGQAPFAFGWYNYENVVKAVDVIEPYNIGNNVEVIRSLNPNVFMVSTHGFEHKPENR